MAFKFYTENEEIALTGDDADILSHLRTFYNLRYKCNPAYPETLCDGSIHVTEVLERDYDERPHDVKFTAKDIREFIDGGLECFERGFFSVAWSAISKKDQIYQDGFRFVVSFRAIEVMLRPLEVEGDDNGPPRIYFTPGDVKDCLRATLDKVLRQDSKEPINAVVGKGFVTHPATAKGGEGAARKRYESMVPFEWKVDRVEEDKLDRRVRQWRYEACGGVDRFKIRKNEYSRFLEARGIAETNDDSLFPTVRRLGYVNQAAMSRRIAAKRPSGEIGASQEITPSRKRRSMLSQASSGSQSESAPPSQVSSPVISGPPSLSGAIMGPPRVWGPGQPRGSRGSMGSFGSETSVVSTMAGLSFQSPVLNSQGNMPPPPEGSSWGRPQGMTEWTPTEFRGRYTPQYHTAGYQGPGQAQPPAGYAQPADVYGYPSSEFQEPPPRSFDVVNPNIQPDTQHGGWNAPPPGRQRMSAEQAAAQLSHQHARVGLVPSHTGGGNTDDFRSNVSVPRAAPNIQHGRNYPRIYPPVQSIMHGGGDRLPQHPQHSPAPRQGERDILYSYPEAPRAYSPEPLDLTSARSGEGNFPSTFPPHVPPMSHFQEMARMPPQVMRGIDSSHFESPRALVPGRENYPLSSAAPLPSMAAGMIRHPEGEGALADSDSDVNNDDDSDEYDDEGEEEDNLPVYNEDIAMFESPRHPGSQEPGSESESISEREDDQLRNPDDAVSQLPQHAGGQDPGSESEPESDGEDDQSANPNAPVSQSLQYFGGQNDHKLYYSPPPATISQAGHVDPLWFEHVPERNQSEENELVGNESEGDDSEGDESEGDESEETDSGED